MEQIVERKKDMIQWIQPYIEEHFSDSCRMIQEELEAHGDMIWNELRGIMCEILTRVERLQKQHIKSGVKYFVFSLLNCSIYLGKIELRIDALDDSFYLDEQEVAGYYYPQFLQDKYWKGLERLYQKVTEKFVRIQNYELQDINVVYAQYYSSIMFRMLESLGSLIMKTIIESGVSIAEDLKILYGQYMDKAAVVYKGYERQ